MAISELITFDEYCVYWIHIKDMCLETEGYVGVAKDANQRWNRHKRSALNGSTYKVHNAIRKYGDDIIYVVLATGTRDECLEFEKFLRPEEEIGWNLAIGGSMPPINRPTKEQAKIASDARIGIKHSKESKRKMSESLTGRKQSQEEKDKRAESLRGGKRTKEQRQKMSIAAKQRGTDNLNKFARAKKVENISTGIIYKSAREASISIGRNVSYVSNKINSKTNEWRYI